MPAGSRRAARFAVVRAQFNDEITSALLDGALEAFTTAKVKRKDVTVIDVPGAYELPVAALWLARSKRYAAIVALGCVIRGETPHFAYVAGEAARGLNEVALSTGVPVSFGVITTDTVDQARARARRGSRGAKSHAASAASSNKGFEAAQVALAMAKLKARL